MKVVKDLSAYDPLYVSVTYGAGGTTRDRTVNTLKWIKQETDLTVMSHLTCIGATRASLGALLREYRDHGIDNILALRGDPPKNAPDFDPARGEFKYARDLVEFVKNDGHFSIAVAVYPEGHGQSPSIEKDMEYTKQKIDAGADFGITQMFFDNRYYYEFMDRAEKLGITIPILPGIMPIIDCKKIRGVRRFLQHNRAEGHPGQDGAGAGHARGNAEARRGIRDQAVRGPDKTRREVLPLLHHEPVRLGERDPEGPGNAK